MANINRMSMLKTAFIAFITLGISATATASITSPIASATLDLQVGQPKTASIQLQPTAALISTDAVILATGTAESTDAKVAYRWASGNISHANKAISSISNTDGNRITMELSSDTDKKPATPAGDGWIVAKENPTKFKIKKTGTDKMEPGLYRVTIEAVAWGN